MATKRRVGGKFAKGNKSGTPKKASPKKMPAFLAKKLGRKGTQRGY
jgi:hypothetical protein